MTSANRLPPDQLAVLQMILQRGHTYDQIATTLRIERAAVRDRALAALDALTPPAVSRGPERSLVSDYLLGQLPRTVADQVQQYLTVADADRAWGQALAPILEALTTTTPSSLHGGAPPSQPVPLSLPPPPPSERVVAAAVTLPPSASFDDTPPLRRSGRRLLGAAVAFVVASVGVSIFLLTANGPSSAVRATHHRAVGQPGTKTAAARAAGTRSARPVEIHLNSPSRTSAAVGVAEVVRHHGVEYLVLAARGVPANTAHNAYAVWLSDTTAHNHLVGWVPDLVGAGGRLRITGRLPADSDHFVRILIALQTQPDPKRPGHVILVGTVNRP
ncbi:MAG: hypothetical protein ACP5H2_09240 [Solirubrobacteraceae bacterium]